MPHPFVTIEAANAGCLESPAYARRGLVPKVRLGCDWQPPKREQLDIRAGVYRGFNPQADLDALNVQAALLPHGARGLGVLEPAKKRGGCKEALWWALGIVLVGVLWFLMAAVGPLPPANF